MIDLETLDTASTALILSIGAVEFDQTGIGKQLYTVISIDSCLEHGLTIGQSTLLWWMDRSDAARAAAFTSERASLEQALTALDETFDWADKKVWANGADFDLPILTNAYKAIGRTPPWKFYNTRCYRTVKNTIPRNVYKSMAVEPRVAHDALADAVAQALTLTSMLSYQGDCYAASESTGSFRQA